LTSILLFVAAHSDVVNAAIQLQPVVNGLVTPVFVGNAGDGSNRLFIVERGGVIKVLQPGSSSPTVFLDIQAKVLSGGEQGLLGLAFHPQFASNHRFFVNYTRQTDGATVVSEYLASVSNPNVASLTERVFLVLTHPGFGNHNGGMMQFGDDGFLYIATGDGGSGNDPGNRAQNINDLHGKILRIDVNTPDGSRHYSSPSTNPFYGSTSGADEIYAFGLRHPWRFSFDRFNGDLYVGDVGQNQIEEIDIVTVGGNYGWRIWEGTRCTGNDPMLCNSAGFTFPIAEYNHTAGRCSVTGGYAYRGSQGTVPFGSYLYGDFCSGEIFIYHNGVASVLFSSGLGISSFGEDESGELYVVNFWGDIHRIAPVFVAPPATTLVAPFGTINNAGSVAYTWNAVANATYYYIWINDSSAAPRITQWWSAADAGCSSGTGTCSVAHNTILAPGIGRWWIRTWNPGGLGPWSAPLDFYAPLQGATLVSPGGTISTPTPTYQWNPVSGATYYYLWVNDQSAAPKITMWVPSSACSTTCATTPVTPVSTGPGRWWIRTWSESAGYGSWSVPLDFTR
jgi:hypothetical protein